MNDSTRARGLCLAVLGVAVLGASGCATIAAWVGETHGERMTYIGTRADWQYLANQPADRGPSGKTSPEARAEEDADRPFFIPFVAVDLVLSAVADTVMLPLALLADAQRPERPRSRGSP
jgi:uncharacterized protein YceK